LSDEHRLQRAGLAMALAGSIAFSGKAIIVKLSYRHGVDAIDVIFVRMLLALPLFVLLAWWGGRGRGPLTRRDMAIIAGLGFSGYYLASLLDFLGLQYITASLERLILYLNPTIVLLLGWLLFKRRPSRLQWVALGLSYAGVLVVFGHEVRLEGRDVLLGTALVLASALSYAIYLLYSGEVVKRIGSLRLTGLATSVACALCIAQFVLLRPLESALGFAPAVWWLGVLNALACTFLPVVLVMLAIERIGSAATAQAGMVGPLSTVALGVWLLDEPFSAWLVAGTVLVLAGVWLLARPQPSAARLSTLHGTFKKGN
jgi:drug/metabolite transporter (DMT)-like permease